MFQVALERLAREVAAVEKTDYFQATEKIENILHNKQGREQILNKNKKEIKVANQKENLFTSEEKELLSNFINKIKKELSIDKSQ